MEDFYKIAVVFDNSSVNGFRKDADYSFRPYTLNNPDCFGVSDKIAKILEKAGHSVDFIELTYPVTTFVRNLEYNGYDLIYNLCEGFSSNSVFEVYIAGIFELLFLNYTGNTAQTLNKCLNKKWTKELLRKNGIETPTFIYTETTDFVWNNRVNFPVIVKPAFQDASEGIENNSVVHDVDAVKEAMERLIQQGFPAKFLVEEYIDGREFNVAVMGNTPPFAMPVSEIDFSTMPEGYVRMVTFKAKWDEKSVEYKSTVPVCPAKIDEPLRKQLQAIAVKCYKLLECRDYARVDMRMSKEGEIYVLEVNPNPDISPGAGLSNAATANGWSYEYLINYIAKLAVERRKAVNYAGNNSLALASTQR